MSTINRHAPPPQMHHAQAAAHAAPTQQAQQHAAAQQQPQTAKPQQQQKAYSGGQAGPTGKRPAVPKQGTTTRTRRRAPVGGGGNVDNDDDFGSANPDDDGDKSISASTSLGGGGARQQEGTRDGQRGGAQDRPRQEVKDKKKPMTHSRNMGNTGGVKGGLAAYMSRVASRPLSDAARLKRETACFLSFATGYYRATGEFLKPPASGAPSSTLQAFGALKDLQDRFFEDLKGMSINGLDRKNKPTMMKMLQMLDEKMPKFDPSKHVMTPGLQTMYCLAWPTLDQLFVPRSPEQFKKSSGQRSVLKRARTI